MLARAVVLASLAVVSRAHADAGDVSASVRVVGDSRGAAEAGAWARVGGINCDLATVDGAVGFQRDGASWSASERLEVCPWNIGLLDLRISQEAGVGILPDLSDRYLVSTGTPYTRTGWGVELGIFDLLVLFTPRMIDPATLGVPGAPPRLSLARAIAPQKDRIVPLAFWVRYARTTQADRTLEEESWGFAAMRWLHDGGLLDVAHVDVGAATWGDGTGVAPLTFYPARLAAFPLGPLTLDLAAGWAAAGGRQSNPQFATETPPALEGVSIVGGHARLHLRTGRVETSLAVERTMSPYLADGIAIDARASAQAAWSPRRGRIDRLAARWWAGHTERIDVDGARAIDETGGGALDLGVPLPRRMRVDVTAELGRSFYPRPGEATMGPALGGVVTATVSAAFGEPFDSAPR